MASQSTKPDVSVSKIIDMLGSELNSKSDVVKTVGIRAKYIGLYFSAHWCPPCRAFTPKLVKFYEQFKSNHPSAHDFELVFISSDRSSAEAAKYYSGMPWLMLPYSDRARREKLAVKCEVRPFCVTIVRVTQPSSAVAASPERLSSTVAQYYS
jgi:nucleoredoxin